MLPVCIAHRLISAVIFEWPSAILAMRSSRWMQVLHLITRGIMEQRVCHKAHHRVKSEIPSTSDGAFGEVVFARERAVIDSEYPITGSI